MTPDQLLAIVRRRVRRFRALRAVATWAWAGALAGLLLVLAARAVPTQLVEPAGLLAPLVAVVVIAGWSLTRPVPTLAVARVADRGLGSRDALSAYLEFRGDPDAVGPFAGRIAERAAVVAAAADPATAVPRPRLPWVRVAAGVLGVLASLVLAALANPQDAERARTSAAESSRDEAAAELRTAARTFGLETETGRSLDELAERILEMTPERALEALAAQEARLASRAGVDLESALAATRGLESSLAASPLPGAGAGTAAEQLRAAADSLATSDPATRSELADRLDALAATQAAGAPDVATALSDAADAVRAGASDAAAALGSAARAQEAQVAAAEARRTAAAAGARVAGARSALSGALRDARAGTPRAAGSSQGQGQGQGQGGQPSGRVGGGQRSGTGSAQGGQGRPGMGSGGEGSSREAPSSRSSVFAPDPQGRLSGDGPQQGSGGSLESTVGQGDTATRRGAARSSLGEAVRRYTPGATRALDQPGVPAAQRELIRDYFGRLAEMEDR